MSFASCAPVSTGPGFLKGSLAFLDCAGEAIGSAGYTALTQPGSVVIQLVVASVTLFIAWHAVRMMFGRTPDIGDAVLAIAKIGLVLMLVTSWPAVRTLFAAPSTNGPAELIAQIEQGGPQALEERLQRADDGIVTLTKWGTGKLDIRAGQTADGQPAASEFAGVGLADNLALGLGRLAYLVSSLLSLGLLKLLGGVMIAALPIFAGLLLFDASRGIFMGWLRLMFALFVASFAVPVILTVELSLLEPWLAAAIEQRSTYYATPSAPTELLAITASFLLILTGSLALLVRSCLALNIPAIAAGIARKTDAIDREQPTLMQAATVQASSETSIGISRAQDLAMSLERLDRSSHGRSSNGSLMFGQPAGQNDVHETSIRRLGPTRRRAKQRVTLSHARRNQS